ncbi:hypothetical protein KKF59_02190 [Patescibacteria group bacterium]|nr:hypothetical protein [Patescibacteria group bacterium]MBU1907920.1 hypothetical protein [Patescibacteria group bacterium]
MDIFEGNYGFWGTIVGLFMHNIPAMILLIVLIVSWKREIVGGIGFILAGLVYIALLMRNPFEWYLLSWAIQISGIAFLIGALLIIGWYKKIKKKAIIDSRARISGAALLIYVNIMRNFAPIIVARTPAGHCINAAHYNG